MALPEMATDSTTFLNSRSATRVSRRPTSIGGVRDSTRCTCPEDVYEYDHDRLVRALTIVAGSREAAADAVQEAFVRLLCNWGRLASYEDPAAWVRRVALNLIHDHHRSVWTQARLLIRLERQPGTPEEIHAFDRDLWGKVRSLPAKQRTAVALRYIGDFTLCQVAEAMQVSDGTVDQHLRRALRTLRKAMEDQP